MKKVILLLLILSSVNVFAQIVTIPDVNFKNALLTHTPVIDTNGDGEIQVSEAEVVTELHVTYKSIIDLTGIESFTALEVLICELNDLTTLDVSNNINLTELRCNNNGLTTLDVSNNIALTELRCYYNELTTLDVSNNINLIELWCSNNGLTTLDVSNNIDLTKLRCNSNELSELNFNTNTALTYLSFGNIDLSSIDLSANTALTSLYFSNTDLSSIDLSANTALTSLHFYHNNLSSIDISANTALIFLSFGENSISNLDVSNNTSLEYISIDNSPITEFDLSNNPNIVEFWCNNNLDLSYLNLKNGNSEEMATEIYDLPNLETVCLDEIGGLLMSEVSLYIGHPVTFTEYCSLTPTLSNQITGTVKIDLAGDGCDTTDIPVENVLIQTNNGTETFATFTQEDGSYILYTNEGNFTTTASASLPSYYSMSPDSYNSIFVGFDNADNADFCLTPTETINDLNISIIPFGNAVPGVNTTYQLVYQNIGTTTLSGTIEFEFIDAIHDLVSTSETTLTETSDTITFAYEDLNPFETRTIDIVLNTLPSPIVEIGDDVSFIARINPIAGDFTELDNVYTLLETVAASYDPNDIHVLEGSQIKHSACNDYLHYVIHFQNEGTSEAMNIVVANELDTNLNWNSIQLQSTSHSCRVNIVDGNDVEFIFEDINLPDSTTDEENSHGFIAYKIKPKIGVNIGDIMPNQAAIFFDFNEAVETNTVTTEVVDFLSLSDLDQLQFSIFPNPTKGLVHINAKTDIEIIKIYNKLGQIVHENKNKQHINISKLNKGIYFCKVIDIKGNFGVKKIVKE